MKSVKKRQPANLIAITLLLFFYCSCKKHEDLILIDENTGKKYKVEYLLGQTYYVHEAVEYISGKDTVLIFKN